MAAAPSPPPPPQPRPPSPCPRRGLREAQGDRGALWGLRLERGSARAGPLAPAGALLPRQRLEGSASSAVCAAFLQVCTHCRGSPHKHRSPHVICVFFPLLPQFCCCFLCYEEQQRIRGVGAQAKKHFKRMQGVKIHYHQHLPKFAQKIDSCRTCNICPYI